MAGKLFAAAIITIAILFAITGTSNGARQTRQNQTSYALASWYGGSLYGNHVACSGISLPSSYRLEPDSWGVANPYMKCGTWLTICYTRCAHVQVIDHGPYCCGRSFDLTEAVHNYIGTGGVSTVRWYYG